MKKLLTLLLVWMTFSAPVTAQNTYKSRLDSLLRIIEAHHKGMGSLAVTQNGVVVYQRAIGLASSAAGQEVPATLNTHYRIGSITKMFTAVMIFQLMDEGRLGLNTTLATFYPNLPNAGKITIGLMLNHRSGLHNFTDDAAYATYFTRPHTQAEMLTIIGGNPSDFEPDSKAAYSNTNFVLLGYIIEKLTGQTYAENLSRRVAAKIGLRDTYYGGQISHTKDEAYSFSYQNGWSVLPETDMSIPGGAGGIVSTPADLTRFISALFNGKLISAQHLEQMKTIRGGYGMAMFKIPFYEKAAYGHTGGIDGFSSMLGYFPEDKVAFAYCSNGAVYATNDILIGVLSIYFGKPYAIPTFKEIVLKSEDLDRYTGTYSSTLMPLKIAVTKNGAVLMAQATGQSAFELMPFDTHKFEFKTAGIIMEFDPAAHTFLLKQGGAVYKFTLEK